MGFMDSYKHLEKLCGEILGDERRVSAYIDEMIKTPCGAYLVDGWEGDLKQLKHYRWVRNQIVHDPEYSEEDLCGPEDALWLDRFYSRIMNQSDPLALYCRACKAQKVQTAQKIENFSPVPPVPKYRQGHTPLPPIYTYPEEKEMFWQDERAPRGRGRPAWRRCFLIALLAAAALFLVFVVR